MASSSSGSNEVATIAFSDILNATGLASLVPKKFRITSFVIDPAVAVSNVVGSGAMPSQFVPVVVDMAVSGNHYQQSNIDKPLRVKLRKDLGSDGQWYSGTSPGTGLNPPPTNFLTVTCRTGFSAVSTSFGFAANVHVRVAWTD